jgi:hypothetical protein
METDRVIPVVIFLRSGNHRTYLRLGGDQCAYIECRYVECNLKGMPSARYYDSNNIVARLNLPNMSYPPQERLEMYQAARTGLFQLETCPEKQLKYADFIDLYANLSEEEIDQYRASCLGEKGEIMGLSNMLREEGKKEGIQQGIGLLVQLINRFGTLPDWATQQMLTASPEQLDRWSERVLKAESIQGVLAE